jgi:hypothetical protein
MIDILDRLRLKEADGTLSLIEMAAMDEIARLRVGTVSEIVQEGLTEFFQGTARIRIERNGDDYSILFQH